jgi:lipoate-protein ligase A
MLQHGSLPLFGDLTRITNVLNYPDEQHRHAARKRLLDHAGTVLSLTGKNVTIPMATEVFISAFAQEFNVYFDEGYISEEELIQVTDLEVQKYKSTHWNYRH